MRLIKDSQTRKDLSNIEKLNLEEYSNPKMPKYLAVILDYLRELQEDIPVYWCRFLKDVSTNSPVTAYIGSTISLIAYLHDLKNESLSGTTIQALQHDSPVLFEFVSNSSAQDRKVSELLIRNLLAIREYMDGLQPHILDSAQDNNDQLVYVPALPKLCRRGSYHADKNKDPAPCRKNSKIQKTLLPGVFLLHCEHGKLRLTCQPTTCLTGQTMLGPDGKLTHFVLVYEELPHQSTIT